MSLILNIDSSLENASVSLAREGSVLHHLTNAVQKDHAAFLHVAIREIFKNAHLEATALDAIAVAAGPGSYTGLRVGFAAAKGLAFTLNKPLISIGSLEMMAKSVSMNNPDLDGDLCPMIDARRAEVFTALYSNAVEEKLPPVAMVLDENSFVTELQLNRIYFFGNGSGKYRELVSNENAVFLDCGVSAEALAFLSHAKYLAKNFSPLALSVPLYVKEFYNG